MKCSMSKEKLVGYLYQDMEPEEQASIEAHLAQCPACRGTLEDLSSTTEILRAWPEEEPNMDLTFVQEEGSRGKVLKRGWLRGLLGRRPVMGVAFGIAAVLVILALVNLEVTYTQGDFQVSMSLLPRPRAGSESVEDPPVTRGEFAAWQEESLQLMQEVIQMSEERQRRERDLTLVQFAQDLERRRYQDLRMVGRGLEVMEASTEDRFRRTGDVLHQLLTVAQLQMVQPTPLQRE